MPKHLLELLNSINTQKALVKSLADEGKLEEAQAAKNQLIDMQAKFDLLKDIEDATPVNPVQATPGVPEEPRDSTHEFARAIVNLANGVNPVNLNKEGTGADGGYTVPEDIQTKINQFREARFALQSLVSTENVSTMSGARTYQTRASHTGFAPVSEAGKIGAVTGPQFARVTYTIGKYAGYLPVTNELLADSDANITNTMIDWLGEEDVATRNALVLGAIDQKTPAILGGLDDVKAAINVTLGQAFAGTAVIVTNDNGLNWMDTLKDQNDRYLLQPDINPATPFDMTLAVGARKVPVVVVPNAILPNVEEYYWKTTDTAVVTGKTYYTRSGSGTAESPYTYTAVESPSSASLSTYYEKAANSIRLIIGDLKEYCRLFDRQQMTIKTSDVAAVGSGAAALNAFEEDLTIFRAIDRLDVEVIDSAAIVNGYLPGE